MVIHATLRVFLCFLSGLGFIKVQTSVGGRRLYQTPTATDARRHVDVASSTLIHTFSVAQSKAKQTIYILFDNANDLSPC